MIIAAAHWHRVGKGGGMATRKTPTGSRKKHPAAKRDLVKAPNATIYAKGTAGGQFKDLVEVGASQRADRRTQVTTKVRSGYGDRGDR
jgi:hypothetical protein